MRTSRELDDRRQLPLRRVLALIPVAIFFASHGRTMAEAKFDWEKERQHWAYQPLQAVDRESIETTNWTRNSLDSFVLKKMSSKGYQPAAQASPAALVRRLTIDLTGLPPDYEDTVAFVQSENPEQSYEHLVEQLLRSPRFGERLASMWLTVARFAEDQAHQVGNDTKYFYPNAHLYRNWVIDAFNNDMPYDQFVAFQLGADFLGDEGKKNLVALGFLGLGPKYYNRKRLDVLAEEWEDRVDTVTRGFLGLTVACARCHDHMDDAISAEDYHGLAGVFASTKMTNQPLPGAKPKKQKDGKEKINADQTMHIVKEGDIQNLPVFLRGNVDQKGDEVPRRFLTILSGKNPVLFENGSGRLDLAHAITGTSSHLSSRVMVNRIWELIVGNPLVSTPSNFGKLSEKPIHSDLLDFLAADFIAHDWAVKHLVRQIVMSATYRQSSNGSAREIAEDPGNRYLARMNRRKASAEILRDSLLAATGELKFDGNRSVKISDPKNVQRTIYGKVSRKELDAYLAHFDYPDANVHCAKRNLTTTPAQKLFLLNSDFLLARSDLLAKNLSEKEGDTTKKINAVYRQILTRNPDSREMKIATEFITQHGPPTQDRWSQFAQALLASNEFSYRD